MCCFEPLSEMRSLRCRLIVCFCPDLIIALSPNPPWKMKLRSTEDLGSLGSCKVVIWQACMSEQVSVHAAVTKRRSLTQYLLPSACRFFPFAEKEEMISSLGVKTYPLRTLYINYVCCLHRSKRCYFEDNHVDAFRSLNINRLQRIMSVPEHASWSLCVYFCCVTGDKSLHFLF